MKLRKRRGLGILFGIHDKETDNDDCGNHDDAEVNRLLEITPIHPRMAKIVAEVMGKEYLQAHFNITRANEIFGEGWLDEIQEETR